MPLCHGFRPKAHRHSRAAHADHQRPARVLGELSLESNELVAIFRVTQFRLPPVDVEVQSKLCANEAERPPTKRPRRTHANSAARDAAGSPACPRVALPDSVNRSEG